MASPGEPQGSQFELGLNPRSPLSWLGCGRVIRGDDKLDEKTRRAVTHLSAIVWGQQGEVASQCVADVAWGPSHRGLVARRFAESVCGVEDSVSVSYQRLNPKSHHSLLGAPGSFQVDSLVTPADQPLSPQITQASPINVLYFGGHFRW